MSFPRWMTGSERDSPEPKSVRDDGLLIHQPPFFENADPVKMLELYDRFGVEKLKFVGIEQPLVLGTMYFIKLRHEAIGKFSARSAGQVSLLNVPFKSNEMYKKGTAPHNNSPIRFGKALSAEVKLL